MKNFERFLPKQTKSKKVPDAIMVRPSKDDLEWLHNLAVKHNVSVNKIVVAIIKDARETSIGKEK